MNPSNRVRVRTRSKHSADLRIPVIKSTVLGVDVVRGFARLCDLARVSRADIYDAKHNPTGTQRDLSPKHARDAYLYVKNDEIAFWPEIFLSLRDKTCLKFISADDATGYGAIELNVRTIESASDIKISRVDGNHRLHFADGRSDGFPQIEKIVSFCLATSLDLDQEIKLFRDINNNQRRMNTSHLDNIKIRLHSQERIAQTDPHLYIAQRLKDDDDSPLFGLIYDGGRSDIHKFIPLRTLKTGLEYMFSRPTRLTALEEIDIQIVVIKNYFKALKLWQPSAWQQPKDYILLRGAGLWGACFLGAEIIDRALAKGNYKPDDLRVILESGAKWDWSRRGSFQGLSGRAGALRIRDMIAAELQDESGVSLKTVMNQIAREI